jgi:hypothetical protein
MNTRSRRHGLLASEAFKFDIRAGRGYCHWRARLLSDLNRHCDRRRRGPGLGRLGIAGGLPVGAGLADLVWAGAKARRRVEVKRGNARRRPGRR